MKQFLSYAALATLIGVFFVCLAFGVRTVSSPTVAETQAASSDAGPVPRSREPDAGSRQSWLEPAEATGDFVALLDGEPVEAEFIIGASGVHPALRATGESVALPEPAATLTGEYPTTVEVFARADGRAYWDVVSTDTNAVELTDAGQILARVVDEAGRPVGDASVLLARRRVGLVTLRGTTDAHGVATFTPIPDGQFWLSVTAPGFESARSSASPGDDATVVLRRARPIAGIVTDPIGKPVAGALVAIHRSSAEELPLDDLPVDLVETDMLGEFRSRAAGERFVAAAVAPGYAQSTSGTVVPEDDAGPIRLDVRLRSSRTIEVTVTDGSGDPVPAAFVQWIDESTGYGVTRRASADGRVRLTQVPDSARVRAWLGRFESPRTEVASLPTGSRRVTLVLDVADLRTWRYRIETPDGVTLHDLEITDGSGTACWLATENDRDWVASGCGDGAAHIRAQTSHGTIELEEAFVDGTTLGLPDPTQVELTVVGSPTEAWDSTHFMLVDPSGASAPLTVEPVGPAQRAVRTAVYPGEWTFTVSNRRLGSQEFRLAVEGESFSDDIELTGFHRFRVWAVDRYDAPITGAYMMLYQDGELVDLARSAGQLPTVFAVRPPFEGTVLIVDPRRGEGSHDLSSAVDDPEVRAKLDAPVLSHRVPSERPTADELAALLGARLVSHDDGHLLDFERSDAAGRRAGLRRGDHVVSAWPEQTRHRVIVWRSGAGYIDVAVP